MHSVEGSTVNVRTAKRIKTGSICLNSSVGGGSTLEGCTYTNRRTKVSTTPEQGSFPTDRAIEARSRLQ